MQQYRNVLFCCLLGLTGLAQAQNQNAAPPEKLQTAQSESISVESVVTPIVRSDYLFVDRDTYSTVPEPEGWAMYLLGLGFVVVKIRRYKKKNAVWNIRNHGAVSEQK